MHNMQSEPAYGGSANGKTEMLTSSEAEKLLGMCRGYMSYVKGRGFITPYSTVQSGRNRVNVFLKSDVLRLKDEVGPKPHKRHRRKADASAPQQRQVPQATGSDSRVERLAKKMAALGVTPNGVREAAMKIGLAELERMYG